MNELWLIATCVAMCVLFEIIPEGKLPGDSFISWLGNLRNRED